MTTLADVASYIKSANAGATQLTIDIGFTDAETYRAVIASGAFDIDVIAARYRVGAAEVDLYHYEPALTVKVTIPRQVVSGGIGERDFDGVQQYIPLLDVPVAPISAPGAVGATIDSVST